MQKVNMIEIGFGPHSKRVYAPALEKWGGQFNSELSLVVDLKEKEEDIRNYFKQSLLSPNFLFIDPFEGKLPPDVENYLNRYIEEHNIKAVIISTDPLHHFAYAVWAIENKLNILMDKPVTTQKNVVSSMKAARGIEEDFEVLLSKYLELQKQKGSAFIVNTQRRFQPGFKVVTELLSEIALKTNCPITSIQSTHCDGQWRLPNEMVSQNYHPYNSGYGKASHSGYHIFDAVYQFYKVSKLTGKVADNMEIFSSFVQPKGFLHQMNQDDYSRYFGKDYENVKKSSDKELNEKFEDYGEIDLSSIITLKKGDVTIGNISINLLHNSFARRDWVLPGKDLYKGNGRVKHEYHNIEQGPFQNIQIHSYQSKDKHDTNTAEDYNVGGNNHFDIYVFRNKDMTGDKTPLRIIRMNDLKENMSEDKLVIEQVKHKVVVEFLSYLQGLTAKSELTSNIDDHKMPVQIMSGIYQSHNKYLEKENPLVTYNLSL